MELNTREQKIAFLKALQEGRATLKQLVPLKPFGMIIEDKGLFQLHDGRTMNEAELNEYLAPYDAGEPGRVYGMVIY